MKAWSRGAVALGLGWALFWFGVYWAGIEIQTWVFSKQFGKPAGADLLEPLHFWFPATVFFVPIWWASNLLDGIVHSPTSMVPAVRAGAVAWSLLVAGLLVRIETALLDDRRHRPSAWALAGTIAALLALWAAGRSDRSEAAGSTAGLTSGVLLSALAVATYGAIAIGLFAIARRRLRAGSKP